MRELLKRLLVIAALGLAAAANAQAQTPYPNHAVRIVVPFTPGGASDAMMRILGVKLSEMWGQPVVIDNRPGAGTIIGTDVVAKSAPDGHTMGLVITSHVINPAAKKPLPYDTLKDLAGVSQLAVVHQALFARNDLPINSVKDLIEYSKARPGRVTFGTAGAGNSAHLVGEMFNLTTGASIVNVPYKGSAQAQTDLIGGHTDLIIDALSAQMPMVEAGKMRLIALASPQRHPTLKQYPTIAETVPGVSVESFFGIIVPAATPRPVVQHLNHDLVAALNDPAVKQKILDLGLVPVGSSPEEFDAMIRSEIAKWATLITKANLKIE